MSKYNTILPFYNIEITIKINQILFILIYARNSYLDVKLDVILYFVYFLPILFVIIISLRDSGLVQLYLLTKLGFEYCLTQLSAQELGLSLPN